MAPAHGTCFFDQFMIFVAQIGLLDTQYYPGNSQSWQVPAPLPVSHLATHGSSNYYSSMAQKLKINRSVNSYLKKSFNTAPPFCRGYMTCFLCFRFLDKQAASVIAGVTSVTEGARLLQEHQQQFVISCRCLACPPPP